MAVQDLTPHLRTRLSRVERAVGIFVTFASLLLFIGFGYYVHHMAQRKGWFLTKLPYHTFLKTGAGLKVGDPVRLMGFDAGELTAVIPMPPDSTYGNVYIELVIRDPHFGYIWTDSKIKVNTADFLGKRVLEISKGGSSGLTNITLKATYQTEGTTVKGIWNDKEGKYVAFDNKSKGYFLEVEESPALGDRLETMANMVEQALPNILNLTNQLAGVLSNATALTSNANHTMAMLQPAVSNVVAITENLKNPKGSLGDWVLPTNLTAQVSQTLTGVDQTLTNATKVLGSADTNLVTLNLTLENLANITSNLNAQVQANTNIVGSLSTIITHSDEMIQGLKGHWLLKSAFKNKTNETKKSSAPTKRNSKNSSRGFGP